MLFANFKDTIFLKSTSELENKYEALKKLREQYPDNEQLEEELYIVKKGLDGEKEIEYQLNKANIGMYVLHDINLKYENLNAQIDFIIFTRAYIYFVECKNLIGNITIDNQGNFIREYIFNNKKIKKGMYSPLRQVEAQRDVYYKIWNSEANFLKKTIYGNKLNNTFKVLVVAANNETILNTKYAPKEVKSKVIKADSLINTLQYDLNHEDKDLLFSKKDLEKFANKFLQENINEEINYVEYYKNKLCLDNDSINLKEKLLEFRKNRANEMHIPAYYVFTNDELTMLINLKPKSINELKNRHILSEVKIKTHGQLIIEIINKFSK